MPALPRGTCPACGANVALRKGGLFREHLNKSGRVCDGAGEPDVPRLVPAVVVHLAFTIRLALLQLREHVEDQHTLELVCDRWDELEQEIGTDQLIIV